MSYEFQDFIEDVRTTLRRGQGKADVEAVRGQLARLLANPAFVEHTCGAGAKPGLHRIHVDPELGFEVLAYVNEKPRQSPPHDHGASWAVYGQAVSHTDMTEYRRVDDGSVPGKAKLEETRRYRLNPGEVGMFLGREIHAIDYPAESRFVRVTGTNLDRIERNAYDLETGGVRQMAPQGSS
jgi:hypothetical protein